jgi:hypothetical protein
VAFGRQTGNVCQTGDDAAAAYASRVAEQARRGRGGDDGAMTGLTGGGPSLLGVDGSMRARDVSRPREEDVAVAEELVQVSYRPRSRPASSGGGPTPA